MTGPESHYALRDLLTRAEHAFTRGEPGWRELVDDAHRLAADMPAELRDDATMRLSLFELTLALTAGDGDAALRHGDTALDALRRHIQRTGIHPDAVADNEFKLRIARAGALAYLGDHDAVAAEWPRLTELARLSANPAEREIDLLLTRGDLARDTGDPATARAAYGQAVAASRRRPDYLGTALVSLAHMEAVTGDADAAAKTIARAEALVADQPTELARLQEVKMTLARARSDVGSLLDAAAGYARLVDESPDVIARTYRTEAAAGAALRAHADGDFDAAAELFLSLADDTANDANRALMLMRAAAARHDAAVAASDAARRDSALELLDRADELLAAGTHPAMAADATVARAILCTQWPWTRIEEYRAMLPAVQAAAIALREAAMSVDTPRARREYARASATHAIEAACHIAFGIGEPGHVAAMVEFAAATPALRAVGPSLLVGPPPRLGHLRELEEPYRIAETRFGLPTAD